MMCGEINKVNYYSLNKFISYDISGEICSVWGGSVTELYSVHALCTFDLVWVISVT